MVLKQLLKYLWPEGEPGLRARVVASLVLLFGAKVCSVYVPFMFKHAVDMLNIGVTDGNMVAVLPLTALIGCQNRAVQS
jgi:ABC-type multidrug transport system fused ATPase/permease subunit